MDEQPPAEQCHFPEPELVEATAGTTADDERGLDPYVDPVVAAPRLSVPQLIRAARGYADLSQRELAQRAGVSKSRVADIESGRTAAPSYVLVERLLSAAGLLLRAVEPGLGLPMLARRHDGELDAGGRHFPGHLNVRPVLTDSDWWHSKLLPQVRPRPAFTADWRRNRGRVRVRRTAAERRAALLAGAAQCDGSAPDVGSRNTPLGGGVSGDATSDG